MNQSFFVKEWEIWHTFSTYITKNIDNLELLAEKLVEEEIADCSIISDGKTFCRKNKGIAIGQTNVNLSENLKTASIQFVSDTDDTNDFSKYAYETWSIGCYFLFCESRFQVSNSDFPSPHLRAFLRPISLFKNGDKIIYKTHLYPILILYKTGILILEFRIFSPLDELELSQFIEEYVNLHEFCYDCAMVSPEILKMATKSYNYYNDYPKNIFQYWKFEKDRKTSDLLTENLSKPANFGDFVFDILPLPNSGKGETITSITQKLFSIVGLLLEKQISSISYLVPHEKGTFQVGNYWTGRPHVHLIKHTRQQETASLNVEKNRIFFSQIISRLEENHLKSIHFLPEDSRILEDYSSFITSAVTLWVWSKDGLTKQEEFDDINKANLIYDHQVQAEILEYGFMLHRSLLERSKSLQDYDKVLAIRRSLANLKSTIIEATPYGETRDLLFKGWSHMNIEALQTQISENLSILENEIKFLESKKNENFRLFLSLFGIIASASLTKSTIAPIWKLANFGLPVDENLSEIFLVGVSAGFTLFLVLLVRYFTYSK